MKHLQKKGNQQHFLRLISIKFDSDDTLKIFWIQLIKSVNENSYIAINAYMVRNNKSKVELQKLRAYILSQSHAATTLGFGPRFLHSTGQLHKGGSGNAIFIQITDEISDHVEIPGFGLTFGELLYAQALGDYESLKAQGRKVIWIQLKQSSISDLYT